MKTSSKKNKKTVRKTLESKRDRRPRRDHTKYKFGGKEYGKSQLVFAVVEKYMKDHPRTPLAKLRETLQAGSYPLVETVQKAKKTSEDYPRYSFREDHVLTTGDGKKVVVCNQWGINNIDSFLEVTKKIGYRISVN